MCRLLPKYKQVLLLSAFHSYNNLLRFQQHSKKKKRIRHSIKGLGSHYPMISNCHQESLSFLFGHVKLHRFFKQSFILDMSDHHTNLFLTAKLKSSIAKVSLENRTNFPV